MELPIQIIEFIRSNIVVDNLCLPQQYPTIEDFEKFQAGYRYNAVTNENLVGREKGDFKEAWYVIATNYFDDPFYVDFSEQDLNFPVYYSQHGSGTWSPVKVSQDIKNFSFMLKNLRELQNNKEKLLFFLNNNVDLENELWKEVYVTFKEKEND